MARSRVSNETPRGICHSSSVNWPASSATDNDRLRRSRASVPLIPESPGTDSQSSPRATRWRAISSGSRIRSLPDEHLGDTPNCPEIVHANTRVRNRGADCIFGPRDELQNADRIDEAALEQRRVRINDHSGAGDAGVQPGDHLVDELRRASHAASFATHQLLARSWASIAAQYVETAGAAWPTR